jgi:hypothetical protein
MADYQKEDWLVNLPLYAVSEAEGSSLMCRN